MFRLPKQNRKKTTGHFPRGNEEACPGTPLYRKKLDGGIQAEANDDGTIFIDESVEPGSAEERQILSHEMKHLTDMKIGKMKYDDNHIKWNGIEYPRENGKILYEGKWVEEGGKEFPWEKH
tara:strand:- start:471 stop:833 length:363 start_codon:yes stop_codon:yes gene_type:complete